MVLFCFSFTNGQRRQRENFCGLLLMLPLRGNRDRERERKGPLSSRSKESGSCDGERR
jgi:hypothetical protein